MIKREALPHIATADNWLDSQTGPDYRKQPLAQDWARVSKIQEELGEAIAELILWTGQNPRKQHDTNARERMLAELADTVLTGILAITHFTKDAHRTDEILDVSLNKIARRANEWQRST
jgi:hypothetical protein